MALGQYYWRMEKKPQESASREADKYIVRFPEGMRDRIAEAAKVNNRSMNAEIVARLEKSFEDLNTPFGAELLRAKDELIHIEMVYAINLRTALLRIAASVERLPKLKALDALLERTMELASQARAAATDYFADIDNHLGMTPRLMDVRRSAVKKAEELLEWQSALYTAPNDELLGLLDTAKGRITVEDLESIGGVAQRNVLAATPLPPTVIPDVLPLYLMGFLQPDGSGKPIAGQGSNQQVDGDNAPTPKARRDASRKKQSASTKLSGET